MPGVLRDVWDAGHDHTLLQQLRSLPVPRKADPALHPPRSGLADEPVPLYGDGLNVRDWLHVEDHCRAVAAVLERGEPGAIYNVGGSNERTNREITAIILDYLGKSGDLISYVTDRLGHDRRYAIDSSGLQRTLGWKPEHTFEEGVRQTIDWYRHNLDWVSRVTAEVAE